MRQPREDEVVERVARSAGRPVGDGLGELGQDELVEDVVADEGGQDGRPGGQELDGRLRVVRLPGATVQ
jgi:hypothetical protein